MAHHYAAAGFLLLSSLATSAFGQDDATNPCQSFGVDFQNGGSYFQNLSSSDPFTFVSYFEGCQTDTCDNILVDPSGNEYQCSDTNLTPADVNMLSTCPLNKDQMSSGEWSVLLISNDGDADPIAYERDFYLTVAVPSTVTFTPTITLSATTTAVQNVTATQTTLSLDTITSLISTNRYKPTTTVTPSQVTTTRVVTLGVVPEIAVTAVPVVSTKTITQTCSVPEAQRVADPTCTITPYLVKAAALATEVAGAVATDISNVLGDSVEAIEDSLHLRRRRDHARRVPSDRETRIAERKARLAAHKEKRGLDVATTTITDTNTANFLTVTSLSTVATTTLTITSLITSLSTTTTTDTVYNGATMPQQVTITAATPTKTETDFTIATSYFETITNHPTVIVTVSTAPAASTSACSSLGGQLV